MAKKGFFDSLADTFDSLVDKENIKQSTSHSDFFYAVRHGKADKVLELLKKGQNANVYNLSRKTALHIAMSNQDEEIAALLIQYKADPYKPTGDMNKTTAVDMCIMRDMDSMLKLFKKYGVDFNHINDKGETALYKAVEENKFGITETLLKWGANPLSTGEERETPLDLAFKRKYTDIVNILMESNVFLNNFANKETTTTKPNSFLHQAMHSNAKDAFYSLLKQGSIVNTYNSDNETPLQVAVDNEYLEYATLLVDHGADLNIMPRGSDGYLPLHILCSRWKWNDEKSSDMLNMLLFAGANPNIAETENNRTPLTLLLMNNSFNDHEHGVNALLEHGAVTNIYDTKGKTPLLYAMELKQIENKKIIKALLNNGANPNLAEKKTKTTPLHYAIMNNQIWMVNEFMAHGANPLLKDSNGKTALDTAMEINSPSDILEVITKATKDYKPHKPTKIKSKNITQTRPRNKRL